MEGKGSVPSAVKAILDYIKFPTVVVRSAWSPMVPRERVGTVVEVVGDETQKGRNQAPRWGGRIEETKSSPTFV